MEFIIDVFSVLILCFIIIQDIKQRQISWILLHLLALVFFANWYIVGRNNSLLEFFSKNTIFLVLQFLILFLFYTIRKKKIVNLVNSMIGAGDLLMLLVLCF